VEAAGDRGDEYITVKKERMFFFEKKNQKTFASLRAFWAEGRDSE
jgi:hypothetical protein